MGRLNKVQLIGRTGNEIKIHNFENGNAIGNVSLATTETYKNQQGEKVENTEWHNLVFRNKACEIIEKYVPKGTALYVEGRLKYRKWQDKEGVDRYSTEIHISDFEFIEGKKDSNSSSVSNVSSNSSQPPQQNNYSPNEEDDGLPF
jgi:single-strand DNA-binding protein